MRSSIMKASVGIKRAVEDTVTDTQTDNFIIIAVLYILKCLVTVTSHARHAKHVQRLKYYASMCVCVCVCVCPGHKSIPYLIVVTG